jgi:thiol-disulfide isomerase/thioredoxin
MKEIITIVIGAIYVAFACFMASSSKITPSNYTSIKQGQFCEVIKKDEKSNKYSQRLLGPMGMPLVPETIDGKPVKYQMPPQANIKIEQELKFEPNCMILWCMENCKPCKKMTLVAAKLRKEGYDIHVLYIKEYSKLAKKMSITSFPTTIIRDDCKEVKRFVGLVTGRQIKKYLKYNESNYDVF